jgi:hypothetical protein
VLVVPGSPASGPAAMLLMPVDGDVAVMVIPLANKSLGGPENSVSVNETVPVAVTPAAFLAPSTW